MRRCFIAGSFSLAAIALIALAPAPAPGQSQGQLPLPPGGFKPPPPAPVKPYKPVAVTPPQPLADPSFDAFRKELGDAAQHKDRTTLAKLVVAQGFFWIQDRDVADKGKSGIDNLAAALDLNGKDNTGWDLLAGYADDGTAAALPDHSNIVCSPADPTLDAKALEALSDSTQTDPSDWGYPSQDGIPVYGAAQPNAPVVDKLGIYLVRVLPDSAPPQNPNAPAFLHVALPSGMTGYVLADALTPLGGDQICYIKDAAGWKITGYFGGAAQ